jgi:nucleoid-associated protein YejK
MKRKLNDISLYFTNWISAADKESNKSFTQDFYTLMNLAALPVDQAGHEIPRDTFKKNVYDLIKSAPTQAINILAISQHFYTDDDYLVELGEQNSLTIDTEFQPDEKVLKKFISIEVVSDGISLRFPRGELNTKIRFDGANDDIVIIESRKFARDLREEVNRHGPH